MRLQPLLGEERLGHMPATHIAILTNADLTQASTNTAQVINLMPLIAKQGAEVIKAVLKTPFQNTADSGFNTTAVTIGDSGTANSFLTSMELNVNGSLVYLKFGTGTKTVYTSADNVAITFNSMSAKALVNLNAGELWVYLKLTDANV